MTRGTFFPLSALRRAVILGALAFPVAAYGQTASDEEASYAKCISGLQAMQEYYAELNAQAYSQLQAVPVQCSGNIVCIGYLNQALYIWYARQYSLISDWYGEIAKCYRNARN